ncbi:hypothetical protein BaRGS_00012462 [Batillaria attramentaria]|uniref:C-type lectin domain-containing protein n=1 Tax=Batillaria attramentaria TaxID=370345 RepID=A0ABD0LA75_9CAEN
MNRTVAVLLMLCAVANRAERTGLATRYGCLDNREFSDNLLFESSAVSNTECGLKCLSHAGCVAFTTLTPSGICRGHSSVSVANSSFSPLSGAQTWTFQDGVPCPNPCYQLMAPGTCLRFHQIGKNHSEASNHCQREGARLYNMKSWERRDVLKKFMDDQGLQNTLLWLDAVEEVEGGNWLWGDGHITPRDSSMWHTFEPNDLGGADCMQTLGDYYLDDAPCKTLVQYVCEMPIP